MAQWFFHPGRQPVPGQQPVGPLDDAAARAFVQANPGAYCWREGYPAWVPVAQVGDLGGAVPVSADRAPGPSSSPWGTGVPADPVPDPVPGPTSGPAAGQGFEVRGHEMQYVELALAPGDSVIAEAGAMLYKDAGIGMETIFGDGSTADGGGILGQLLGAGRRVLSGSTLFTTLFTQRAAGIGKVAFAAPYPGTIHPLKLSDYGGRLICHKDSFLAAARGVAIGIYFQRRILTGLFGGDGFIMQSLDGDGWVFIHMGGTMVERTLAPGEALHVDTGCLAAMTASVDFDIEPVGGIKSMLFGGEGLFFARLTGPGKVWLQSLPFSRLAGRMQHSLTVGDR